VLSYDHAELDDDFRSALAVSTGEFAEEYRRTSDEVVRPLASKTQATVVARVVDAGVVEASADRVVVLVFVNQTTTSNRLDGPKTDLTRVRMTMVRAAQASDGGKQGAGAGWLVAKVDAL
jgi:Mce-associated membrane protein